MDTIAPKRHLELPVSLKPAIQLALAMLGQWRMAGGGLSGMRPIAFDLNALDVAARWLGITDTPALFRQIGLIEGEALKAMEKPE